MNFETKTLLDIENEANNATQNSQTYWDVGVVNL